MGTGLSLWTYVLKPPSVHHPVTKKIVTFQCKYCACHNNPSVNVSTSVEVDACESCSSFVPTAS